MVHKNNITSLNVEEAYAAVELLTDKEVHHAEGAEVYRGIHPQWGLTVLIFPAFGDPINVPMPETVKNIIPVPLEPEITVIQNADEALAKTL